VPEGLPLVPMDFPLLLQVLVNLLDNALKYSAAGEPIDIAARGTAGGVEIEVSDRGIGIPVEDLQRVFDKFYRVQGAGRVRGTGLGLAISRGIVEAHGGEIEARARAGGGTTVLVRLPTEASAPIEGEGVR